jgi:hypothetical protein
MEVGRFDTSPRFNMKTIKFIKSPVGFGLGYHVGELAEINSNQADELVENGFAEIVENEIEQAVKTEPKEIKKAVKK